MKSGLKTNISKEAYKTMIKEVAAKMRVQEYKKVSEECEKLDTNELKERIKELYSQEGMGKLAKFQTVLYILRLHPVITDFRTDVIKVYDKDKQYFVDTGAEKIKSILTSSFGLHNTRATSEEVLHLLRTLTYVHDEDIEKAHPKNLIPFKNYILNIDNLEKIKHNPKYLFDYQIPIEFKPKAKCNKIPEFFSQVVEKENVLMLYDIFGLAMYPENILEKFYVLTGIGSNGKSRVLTLLEIFIGKDNYSSITLKQLTEDKFSVARTYKKLINVGADIGGSIIYDTSMLKSASASDSISGQFKFGQIFDFIPTATEIFSANDPPVFADESEGMYRRSEIILFPNKFGNSKDMEEDSEYKKANPNIISEITTGEELSGLLNIAIKHLRNILKTGQLSVVKSTKQLKRNYIKYSNNVKAFLDECCEEAEYIPSEFVNKKYIHAIGFLTVKTLYDKYIGFCEENKLVKKSKEGFSKLMKKLDSWNLEFNQKDGCKNEKERSVRGLKFKDLGEIEPKTKDNEEKKPNPLNPPNPHYPLSLSLKLRREKELEDTTKGKSGLSGLPVPSGLPKNLHKYPNLIKAISKIDTDAKGRGACLSDIAEEIGEPEEIIKQRLGHAKVEGEVYECKSGFWKVTP